MGRSKYTDSSYRKMIAAHLDEPELMSPLLYYHSMDTQSKEDFQGLARRLDQMRAELEIDPSYLFYLATPPALYEIIPRLLSGAGLTRDHY